jgi:hypothetical protein
VRVESGHGSIVRDLEADRVGDLDPRVLDVRDHEPRELFEIGSDDPDLLRTELVQRVDERTGGRDYGRPRMFSLEDRLDLGLGRAVAPWPLGHDRDEARGRDHVRSQIRELRRGALRLLVHRAQRLGRHVLHPQARAVERERVLRAHPLSRAKERGDLGLHRRVRARHE